MKRLQISTDNKPLTTLYWNKGVLSASATHPEFFSAVQRWCAEGLTRLRRVPGPRGDVEYVEAFHIPASDPDVLAQIALFVGTQFVHRDGSCCFRAEYDDVL